MKVVKFGGSSVANATNIKQVVNIIGKGCEPQIIVVSALGGVTDELIKVGVKAKAGDERYKEVIDQLFQIHFNTVIALLPKMDQNSCLNMIKYCFSEIEQVCDAIFFHKELSSCIKDHLISFGELLSSKIIAAYMQSEGLETQWIDSRKVIRTNNNFGCAVVNFNITNNLIYNEISIYNKILYIAPGFIASDECGNITTLGRGGSDYTAAIFAAALNASVLEIWTDVTGMMTADPRSVPNARTINYISYQDALTLSRFGAKVIYPPTIQLAMCKKINTWVKNTFAPNEAGTTILTSTLLRKRRSKKTDIIGISSIKEVTVINIEGNCIIIKLSSFLRRILATLLDEKITVLFNSKSTCKRLISIAVNTAEVVNAMEIIKKVMEIEPPKKLTSSLKIEDAYSIIALVVNKGKCDCAIRIKIIEELFRNNIPLKSITRDSITRNIFLIISEDDVKRTINILHDSFFDRIINGIVSS